MKNKKIIFSTFYLLLIITFLFGCAGIQRKVLPTEEPLLETAKFLKFSDIPVPVGLKFLPQNSYLFESGSLRVGLLRYRGRIKGDEIVSFYKAKMPVYGWSLLNIVEHGDKILNFEKEKESCIITIRPKGWRSDVAISVGPRPPPVERRIERRIERPIK